MRRHRVHSRETPSRDPAHTVRLDSPRLEGSDVVFSWDVTPRTELYTRTCFRISFPSQLDLARVPDALWWRVMLLCLHGHFAVLRPCVVELPVGLGAAEREFWRRLVARVAAHLEAYGDRHRPVPVVEIRDAGATLAPVPLPASAERVVSAFSGGKDSLVQAALAAELTDRPLLVMITSPVPWCRDHVGAARVRARAEVTRRLPVDGLEVHSDFRTCWELGYSGRNGCVIDVHELSDLPLYFGVLAAVAAAAGIGQKLMAAEAEIHYSATVDGQTVLQPDSMYSWVMQHALDELLRGFGQRQGSLTCPLHAAQTQALLLRRYGQLADLQASCWDPPDGERACSLCPKDFGLALVTLSEGVSPRKIGVDPVKALMGYADWGLGAPAGGDAFVNASGLWTTRVVRALQRRSTDEVRSILGGESDSRLGEALAVYARLRAEALKRTLPPEPGYVSDFLDVAPADLRAPLESILAEHFEPTSEPEFAAMAERATALINWITAPLRAPRFRGLIPHRGKQHHLAY